MTIQVPVRLTEEDVVALDRVVSGGRFRNRSDAIRSALRLLLRAEREREIEEAYRRGYGAHPQDEQVARENLEAWAARLAAENDEAPL